jgi:hypothetical protein
MLRTRKFFSLPDAERNIYGSATLLTMTVVLKKFGFEHKAARHIVISRL